MKAIKTTILAALTLGMFATAQAQSTEVEKEADVMEYKNQFYMTPTAMFSSTIQFGYERKTSSNTSLMLSAGMYTLNENVLKDLEVSGNGLKAEMSFNIYSNDLVEGNKNDFQFYFSPYVSYFNASYKIGKDHFNNNYLSETSYNYDTYQDDTTVVSSPIMGDGSASLSNVGLGALVGFKWTVSKRLVFDFYHGGGAQLATYSGDSKFKKPLKDNTFYNFASTGVVGKIGLRVGLLF